MSEQVSHQGHEGRPALQRKGRVVAMGMTLGVSVAQVVAAAVITYGCLAALSVAARNSSGPPGPGSGIPFMLATLLLTPIGAMIVGPLVAGKLQLAARGAYALSVIAAILIAVLGVWILPSLYGNVPLLILVLAAVNLLIGYSTGMHRSWTPPPGTPGSTS